MTTSIRRFRPQPMTIRRSLPFVSREVLLSRGERAFYRALTYALRGRYLIAVKVRAADILSCSERHWNEGYGHMIARHHVDFTLCERTTTKILLAIELDDKSHDQKPRQKRDRFLNLAFEAADVSLVRFKARSRYDANLIREVIDREVGQRLTLPRNRSLKSFST